MGGFNPLKWKIRTFAYVSASLFAFYVLFFYKKTHHVSFDAIIENSEAEAVWEFVADFSNMKKLNPTIEEFHIVAESGNYEHWKYTAHYTEHLSHVPMIKNHAQSHFAVKPAGQDGFLISSEHRTCFFSTFGCLDSVSEFKFSGEGKNTKCIETVQYECPIIFSALCRKEVMYQRQEIMRNLQSHFSMINIKTDDEK
ncbi:uncharacterized protein LOC105683535 [Athalia rosae]|uniref:uncharacterized protein LOC105683535 n=1 Tax=Athalia rosae TaxID=37344 RepID=UPI0020339D98|nr:uncharacterized protein LOC105683535 [Athalia rosae]XP_048512651.1 uncharacterized protein LOC105683535 [Athalia rosae]